MIDQEEYKKKFVIDKRKTDSKQELAKEIYEHFDKKISYPLILKWIKEKGYKFIAEEYHIAQKEGYDQRLFIHRIHQVKIKYI